VVGRKATNARIWTDANVPTGMSQAATLEETALALARRIIELVKELLGQRLVSAAVFGSLAAGRFTEDRTSTSSSSSRGSPTNRWPSG
jgi:hypothetical protein